MLNKGYLYHYIVYLYEYIVNFKTYMVKIRYIYIFYTSCFCNYKDKTLKSFHFEFAQVIYNLI